jgi:hypothetical protein
LTIDEFVLVRQEVCVIKGVIYSAARRAWDVLAKPA